MREEEDAGPTGASNNSIRYNEDERDVTPTVAANFYDSLNISGLYKLVRIRNVRKASRGQTTILFNYAACILMGHGSNIGSASSGTHPPRNGKT